MIKNKIIAAIGIWTIDFVFTAMFFPVHQNPERYNEGMEFFSYYRFFINGIMLLILFDSIIKKILILEKKIFYKDIKATASSKQIEEDFSDAAAANSVNRMSRGANSVITKGNKYKNISYNFQLDGKVFYGRYKSSDISFMLSEHEQDIYVMYDPKDPKKNLSYEEIKKTNDKATVDIAVIIFATLIMVNNLIYLY